MRLHDTYSHSFHIRKKRKKERNKQTKRQTKEGEEGGKEGRKDGRTDGRKKLTAEAAVGQMVWDLPPLFKAPILISLPILVVHPR